jgi:hypothetical protein
MNQAASPNEQTFENMGKYLRKTVDEHEEFSPNNDFSIAMNQSPAFYDPNSVFRKTPDRK